MNILAVNLIDWKRIEARTNVILDAALDTPRMWRAFRDFPKSRELTVHELSLHLHRPFAEVYTMAERIALAEWADPLLRAACFPETN